MYDTSSMARQDLESAFQGKAYWALFQGIAKKQKEKKREKK